MSESADRQVVVLLPGGRCVNGELLARRQDPDGQWWYRVALDVPAAAVQPVPGTDYSGVPTEKMAAHRWLLEALPHDRPEQRRLVLHVGDCWAAAKGTRVMPADNTRQARAFLQHGWATACEACSPEPDGE
ncbi:DUF6233 domain-containing protein [Streptomyces sp. NPDC001068]|uniref:DUF6233 domain-containing protein n=1 Tax=Streptomyces sp. NPDC001068 TaxID=3364544 RepID=UPI0036A8F152